ncbi:MAG: hypothetical protein IT360_01600 [Gemmatimonadaceae bacterium]|nr:hypothetical protein [Gemmatimonadaceae bacterium]
MRYSYLALAVLVTATAVQAQDADRSVKGGIQVAGWKGRVDRRPMSQGKTVDDSKVVADGKGLRLSVGPAGNFWNPANTASGDFTVKAMFDELKMAASHPHSFGIFIGGQDLESENETLMYCIAYGTGKYSIKTFHGEKVTTLVNMEDTPALHKANADGESKNEIGWSVKGGKASCVINGTTVKTLDKSEAVAADKLKSLDGVYGLRVSHNLELKVSEITLTK